MAGIGGATQLSIATCSAHDNIVFVVKLLPIAVRVGEPLLVAVADDGGGVEGALVCEFSDTAAAAAAAAAAVDAVPALSTDERVEGDGRARDNCMNSESR